MSQPSAGLGDAVKASWQRFLDDYEPLRPELYRYCRYLTGSQALNSRASTPYQTIELTR